MLEYQPFTGPANPTRCIDLMEVYDGWYAHEYAIKDDSVRVSAMVYPTKAALIRALDSGSLKWTEWD